MQPPIFEDRKDAGLQLAMLLGSFAGRTDVVVLGLARGGVPVAAEVARELKAPLGTVVVRKLGVPMQPELAMGALGPDGSVWLNRRLIHQLALSDQSIDRVIAAETDELRRRIADYPGTNVDLRGMCVILVDDGLATGASMRAAIASARSGAASEVVVAIPVAAPDAVKSIAQSEKVPIYAVAVPRGFYAVGPWYQDFSPTTDEQVQEAFEGISA